MNLARSVRLIRFVISGAAALLALNLCAGRTQTALCFAAAEDVVVATVNNVSIMKSEVGRLILEYNKKTGKKEISYEQKKQFLKNLIRRLLILQQESVQALKHDKEIVKKVKGYEENLIIARFLQNQVASRLKVNEDELKRYYQENRHKFSSPPKVKARHILLRTREEAEKVLVGLREGEDFGQLAKECSIDLPMALEGGSMGTIEKGRTLPALEKALFMLNTGEISDVVTTRFGYHILTVDEIIPANFKSFKEVRDEIKKTIIRQKEAKAFAEMAARLEKEADIKVFGDRLRKNVD
ncbi:MAG: peptidylprolyl isomerase [Desulfobacterales bacterium]|nr:peptidylprolyl isomerase [Desulfobacterales bacterium]